jgi:pyruvate-ferredoxin/flavodoxin oxidoreductase
MGASDQQTLNAFIEADAYDGPSLIIAYSHCIAHGFDLRKGLEQQKLAVQSGAWPLYRFNPALIDEGKNPLKIDSRNPTIPVSKYAYNETRYRMLLQSDEQRAEALMKQAENDAKGRWDLYRQMAAMHYRAPEDGDEGQDSEE